MTTTDTTVSNLIINTMTQAQYNQITPSDTELYLVTDSTITSSDVTTALGYTPTTPANVDGQWVAKNLDIDSAKSVHATTTNLGTTGTSPLSYLPADCTTYDYLVMGIMYGTTTSGTPIGWVGNVTSPATASNRFYAEIVGDASNRRPCIQFIIPVTNGNIYTQVSAAFTMAFGVTLTGYRRIGTNA